MSKEQVLDKGIRQKSTKRVNSFSVCSAFCPGLRNRDSMNSEKRLRVYTSGSTMACHVWCVDKAPSHTCRNRNACLKVLRLSMDKMFSCTYGIRCELVKWDISHKIWPNRCSAFQRCSYLHHKWSYLCILKSPCLSKSTNSGCSTFTKQTFWMITCSVESLTFNQIFYGRLTESRHLTATQTRSSANGTMCIHFQSKRINPLRTVLILWTLGSLPVLLQSAGCAANCVERRVEPRCW